MKKVLYVILQDVNEDLGEGYFSNGYDQFLGIVSSFKTARNIIEYLTDIGIGEENPNHEHCNGCQQDIWCEDCPYSQEGKVVIDDWNEILFDDRYGVGITYHFKKIEVEV